MHSDDSCKHRRYNGGRERAAHPDHDPVPPPSCSAVGERLARIEDGGVWVPIRVNSNSFVDVKCLTDSLNYL